MAGQLSEYSSALELYYYYHVVATV